jgi:predicted SAM-dependent methyltransferase
MNFFTRRKARGLLEQYRNLNMPVKLHVGCGRNYKDGWINLDQSPKTASDLKMDVRKGLPFPNDSVDYILNEHFIEHLSYEDGLAFLKEAYRVLKPGGVVRTAFPDLDVLIDSYTRDCWRQMEWVRLIKAQWYPSGCFMLNECIREKGSHRYMYSVKELARRLGEAGFAEGGIRECAVHESRFAELKNAERRADSGVVEAQK